MKLSYNKAFIIMANLKLDNTVLSFLDQHLYKVLYLAVSGGVDSMVLLHLVAQLKISSKVIILHFDHQINESSAKWADHVKKSVEQYGFEIRVLTEDLNPKLGLEEAARYARYTAFSSTLTDNDLLLTAHHYDDQQETFIFRALRGSSINGLLGMKPIAYVHGCRVGRPFLNTPKESLVSYAKQHKLKWVEDPSNQDIMYSRNAIRKAMSYLNQLNGFSITHNHLVKHHAVVQYTIDEALKRTAIANHILDIEVLSCYPIEIQELVFHHWIVSQVGYMSHHQSHELFLSFLKGAVDRYPEAIFNSRTVLRYRNLITMQTLPKSLYASVQTQQEWNDIQQCGRIHNPTKKRIHIQPLGKQKSMYKKPLQTLGIPNWIREFIPSINGKPIVLANNSEIFWQPPKHWQHWLKNNLAIIE